MLTRAFSTHGYEYIEVPGGFPQELEEAMSLVNKYLIPTAKLEVVGMSAYSERAGQRPDGTYPKPSDLIKLEVWRWHGADMDGFKPLIDDGAAETSIYNSEMIQLDTDEYMYRGIIFNVAVDPLLGDHYAIPVQMPEYWPESERTAIRLLNNKLPIFMYSTQQNVLNAIDKMLGFDD